MTSVGIATDGVQLHSCPSCGAHAWTREGRRLERSELLTVLRTPPAAGKRASRRTAVANRLPASSSHGDLRDMLRGFTAHGTSS